MLDARNLAQCGHNEQHLGTMSAPEPANPGREQTGLCFNGRKWPGQAV